MLQAAFVESSGFRMVALLPLLRTLVFFSLSLPTEEKPSHVAEEAIVMDSILVGDVTAVMLRVEGANCCDVAP